MSKWPRGDSNDCCKRAVRRVPWTGGAESNAVAGALNLIVGCYDADHLNDAEQIETTLREVIALTPDDLAPVYRLAEAQEDQGLIDAAERGE